MTAPVAIPLLSFAVLALVAGFAIEWQAVARYGRDLPRFATLNVGFWRPNWTMRDKFESERGFNQFMWGGELIRLGAVAAIVVFAIEVFAR